MQWCITLKRIKLRNLIGTIINVKHYIAYNKELTRTLYEHIFNF